MVAGVLNSYPEDNRQDQEKTAIDDVKSKQPVVLTDWYGCRILKIVLYEQGIYHNKADIITDEADD